MKEFSLLRYTLFWYAAGHQRDGQPLTGADLQSPQVRSVFNAFQKQVLVTALTTLDLKDISIRDPQRLPAFVVEYPTYISLKQLPEFAQTSFVPFGVPHNSPLVGFDWNTPAQQEALKKFAEFAKSAAMQKLASKQGLLVRNYLNQKNLPSLPTGEVLLKGEWKYLYRAVDVSWQHP